MILMIRAVSLGSRTGSLQWLQPLVKKYREPLDKQTCGLFVGDRVNVLVDEVLRALQSNTPSKRADAVLDIMQACKAHGYEAEGLVSLASARNSALQQFLKTLLGNDLVLLTPTRKLELTPEEYFGEK